MLAVAHECKETDWKYINTSDMCIKLGDFGCGHVLESVDSRKNALAICGNLAYCAPEVLDGKRKGSDRISYSRKSDIWSVAAVAFKCATGKRLGN